MKTTYPTVFSAFAAVLLSASSAQANFTGTEGMRHYWPFDEQGASPNLVAHDAVAVNPVDGIPGGYVSGGMNFAAYHGFTMWDCFVKFPLSDAAGIWNDNWTLILWVRNPDFTTDVAHTIARGCPFANAGWGDVVPWQVSVLQNGAVRLGMMHWLGGADYKDSEPLEWKQDQWYQVAITDQHEVFFDPNAQTWGRRNHIKVYVTPMGAQAVGDPVTNLEFKFSDGTGLANGNALVIGAALPGWNSETAAPQGYWGGDITEVSLWWETAMEPAEIGSSLADFTPPYHPENSFETFHWNMDETGATPSPVDLTTNGLDGASFGAVSGGAKSPVGGAYKGFNSKDDFVDLAFPQDRFGVGMFRDKPWDLAFWIRNPQFDSDHRTLLARAHSGNHGFQADHAWSVWINGDGRLGATLQDWTGATTVSTTEPRAWSSSKWYLILCRMDPIDHDGWRNRFRVYVTPAEKGAAIGAPELDFEHEKPLLGAGSTCLQFGGGNDGWWGVPCVGGWMGGQIDEVRFLWDGHFDDAWLSSFIPDFLPDSTSVILLK